jgi:hypothetical protein
MARRRMAIAVTLARASRRARDFRLPSGECRGFECRVANENVGMPIANAEGRVPNENVGMSECRLGVPIANADWECRLGMPIAE